MKALISAHFGRKSALRVHRTAEYDSLTVLGFHPELHSKLELSSILLATGSLG
jgi:hypothetical protein